jgi:hypothetical protein
MKTTKRFGGPNAYYYCAYNMRVVAQPQNGYRTLKERIKRIKNA